MRTRREGRDNGDKRKHLSDRIHEYRQASLEAFHHGTAGGAGEPEQSQGERAELQLLSLELLPEREMPELPDGHMPVRGVSELSE